MRDGNCHNRSWRRGGARAIGLLATAALLAGCASSGGGRRLARYRPDLEGLQTWAEPGEPTPVPAPAPAPPTALRPEREPAIPEQPPAPAAAPRTDSRLMKAGNRIRVSLVGIPEPETISDEIDELGQINLPLIGQIKVAGMTTSDAEEMIERAYVVGGFYPPGKINAIVVAEEDEYFVQGEVKREGRYALTGDLTLLQAIAAAGGYTEYAKRSRIRVIRGSRIMTFNAERIERRKEPDPLIKPGDLVKVPRAWLFR